MKKSVVVSLIVLVCCFTFMSGAKVANAQVAQQLADQVPCVQVSKDSLFQNKKTIYLRTDSAQFYITNCGTLTTEYHIKLFEDDSNSYAFRQMVAGCEDSDAYIHNLDSIRETVQPGMKDSVRIQFRARQRGLA